MRPFDYNDAKNGAPVCTRDGRKARIVCWDAKGNFPLLALVLKDGVEEPYFYTNKGEYWGWDVKDVWDLMLDEDYKVRTIVERIKVENNIADLFHLPCVFEIMKMDAEKYIVILNANSLAECAKDSRAFDGDWLIRYDDNTWDILKGGEE